MTDTEDTSGNEPFTFRGTTRDPFRKRRGRPAGSRNLAPTVKSLGPAKPRKQMPDIGDMIADQLRIIQAAQSRVALDLAAGTVRISAVSDLSAALARSMDATEKAAKAHQAIISRLSDGESVEAAIRKLADQDRGVVLYAIRRLRKAADGTPEVPELVTASDAISSLDD